jgi:hypothetical protein
LTTNASKWALFAKDNVFKYGSKAAEKATEITKTVNDKVKEGTLLNSMQTGVVSVTSKVGNISTKAWSDLWGSSYNNNNKSDYNSIPDSQSFNNENSYQQQQQGNDSFKASSSYSKLNNNNDNNNRKQEDWNSNWEDSSWAGNKAKSNEVSTKVEDNWANDDDDNWEPIEPVKPKGKK